MRKLIICILAVGALAGAAWFGRKGYGYWKQEHLVREARYFLSKSDVANALLCLQKTVQANPSNVEACRLLADLAEMARSHAAIAWRARVAALEPGVLRDRIDWSRTALALGDTQAAGEALRGIDEAGRRTADYHKSAAALAWALKQVPEAETNYLEAVRLEPTNVVSQFNLATVQMLSPSPIKADAARLVMEELTTNDAVRCAALRELTLEAAHRGATDRALSFSERLARDPQATFSDQLVCLDALIQARSPRYPASFSAVQATSSTNRLMAFELGNWMFEKERTNDAMAWFHTLAPDIRTNLPLPLLMADGYATLGKWADLEAMLKGQSWATQENLRHIYLARALRSQGDEMAASAEWRSALKASGKRLDALNELGRRTALWGWDAELDETLWALVDNYPLDAGPFLLLYNRLFTAGDTAGLHKLLAKVSPSIPDNTDLENNFALISLLLNSGEQKGHDLAKDVYTKNPKNASFLSTYAYSLYLQHRPDEALKLFGTLPPQELAKPAVAAYYGIILTGAGQHAKAKPYLEMAAGAKLKMLPEEMNLLKKAREDAKAS